MKLFHKISLRGKIFALFASLGLLVILWLTMVRLYGLPGVDEGAIKRITNYREHMLSMQADSKKNILELWLKGCVSEVNRFVFRGTQEDIFSQVAVAQHNNDPSAPAVLKLNNSCERFIRTSFPQLDNLFFVSAVHNELVASSEAIDAISNGNHQVFTALIARVNQQSGSVVITVLHDLQNGQCSVVFGKVVYPPQSDDGRDDTDLQPLGIVVARSTTAHFLDNILNNVDGLGPSAEVVLTADDGTMISHPKHGYDHEVAKLWSTTTTAPQQIDLSHADEKTMLRGYDYRQREVLAAIRYITIDARHRWTMVVKEDWAEIQKTINRIYFVASVVALVGLLVLMGIVSYLARYLTRPLAMLSRTAKLVAAGDFTARCDVAGSTEERDLATVFNYMIERMATWHQSFENEVAHKTLTLQHSNDELHKTQRERTSLGDISNCYLRSGDVDQALELLIERALHFTGAGAGRFRAANLDEAGEVHFTIKTPPMIGQDVDQYEVGTLKKVLDRHAQKYKTWYETQLAQVVREKKILIFNEETAVIFQQISGGAASEENPVHSLMLIPVYENKRIYGVMTLINKPGGFSANDESGVRAFATVAALIMAADKREKQRLAAEESTRIKGEFLATMSHELRTPMNVVIGMSSLMMDTVLSPQQLDYMQKVSTSARQLLALINDILDVSKLEAGHKLSLHCAPFDLEQMLRSVVSLHVYSVDESAVELHVDISRAVPRQLLGDSQRLQQVLSNLLSNAIKFTLHGDILLAVDVEPQQDGEDGHTLRVTFRVSDSGIGISEQQQEHLFTPFCQGDSSITRQHGGTGLGLTISRQLCQLMGGDLEVESAIGVGSTFYFTLPFKVLLATETQRSLLPVDNLRGLPVLVVDDNKLGGRIIRELLERMQFKVTVTETEDAALTALRQSEQAAEPFRLLIIDHVMPKSSGLELIGKIKAAQLSQAPRIVLVSANNQLSSTVIEQIGVAAVVDKPVQASPLFNAIMHVFGYPVAPETVHHSYCYWRDVKLLVVEDVELNRQVVRDLLRKVGIQCSEAINGEVALEMVRHQKYDLVLMDIQMPVMDGFEATRQIRKLADFDAEKLPILAMSADASEQDRLDSKASGMNGHIAKPIDPDDLYQHLQRWLPQHKQICLSPRERQNESANAGFSLPHVDTNRGLRYAGDDKQQYLRHVHGFADQLGELVTELPDELTHDPPQALIRVHTLKGLAGTVGATKLQELARQLETQLRKNEPLSALEPLLSLASEFIAACAHLPAARSGVTGGARVETDQSTPARPQGTSGELLVLLARLSPALENLQARLCSEYAVKLRQKTWPPELASDIDKLHQLVGRYRFIQALEVVKRLQQKIAQ